jgi:hypothetical protein
VRSYDVKIDRRGWTYLRSQPKKRDRSGLPWTPTEDRQLLRRVLDAHAISYADPTVQAAAIAHGRSTSAIAARVHALRAGIRLAMTAKGVA